ncbi:MAG: hypothetical protein ACLUD0_05520 [Eubacterium ramulus]
MVIDFAGYSALWYYCAAIFVVVALLTVLVVKDKPAKSKTGKDGRTLNNFVNGIERR